MEKQDFAKDALVNVLWAYLKPRLRDPWWACGWDSILPKHGVWVWPLVGILRSHVLQGTTKFKTNRNKKKYPNLRVFPSGNLSFSTCFLLSHFENGRNKNHPKPTPFGETCLFWDQREISRKSLEPCDRRGFFFLKVINGCYNGKCFQTLTRACTINKREAED